MASDVERYGYRPKRRWFNDESGKRVVVWDAIAPDIGTGGDWFHGFDDCDVSGTFKTKKQAEERCRHENESNWGTT